VSFKLSKRSLDKMEGVDSNLVDVTKRAIELTKVDFGVIYGMRTEEEQAKLVAAGKSQTMKSNHLVGRAVDLMAYVDGKGCWELNVYDDLCDAMKAAAQELDIAVKWGAAWSEGDIRTYPGSAEDAMMKYIDLRRSQGRRPFIDGPHFELM
jgi:peptidoglycan L-alanyl-D-glutamate endopeptidase CwlK|tara:strand:- start:158 stop:610 length:453 start_codon:yes stop_codon:yes gene_type:complete